MKRLLIAFCSLLLLDSCKKGLDSTVPGTLTPDNFPKTEAEFALFALDAYKPITAKWGYSDGGIDQNLFWGYEWSNIMLNDSPSDLMSVSTVVGRFQEQSRPNFAALKSDGKKSHIEKIRFIAKLTQMIDLVQKATTISDAKKNEYIAEIKTSRGIIMYHLLTMFGPLPVILDPAKIGTDAENDLTRPTREAFVNTIISDLRFAADNLVKSPTQYGRFNKGLALTYLMRTYMNEKNWTEGEKAGREIVALGYSLVDDYMSLFRSATERNNETIYAISCDASANGNGPLGNMNALSYYTYPADFAGITQAGGWGAPNGYFSGSWYFYDSFNPADKRRTMLIPEYTAIKDNGGVPIGGKRNRSNMVGPVIMKYPDNEASSAYRGNDIPLARYADVLLLLAEAINNKSNGPTAEAIELVNSVRLKHGGAGIGNLSAADIASKDAFNDALLRERGWDLFFEGWRRIDLIRFGKWTSALAASGKTAGPELYPIPQYMLDLSQGKLTPTPGY